MTVSHANFQCFGSRLSNSDRLKRFVAQSKPISSHQISQIIPCIPSCIFDFFFRVASLSKEKQRCAQFTNKPFGA